MAAASSELFLDTLLQLTVRMRRLFFFGRLNIDELPVRDDFPDRSELPVRDDLWLVFCLRGVLALLGLLVLRGSNALLDVTESMVVFGSCIGSWIDAK